MIKTIFRLTGRSIRHGPGRFLALLLIVFLSVGFFSGLKITKKAMHQTLREYAGSQRFHDYQVYSTVGWSESDVEAFGDLDGIGAAEGVKAEETEIVLGGRTALVRVMSLTDEVDIPSLEAGRMPRSENECLADARYYSESDIGKTVKVAEESGSGSLSSAQEQLSVKEFRIVGICQTPLYLNHELGAASNGAEVDAYLFVQEDAFSSQAPYSWVSLRLSNRAPAYTDRYDRLAEKSEKKVKTLAKERAEQRWYQVTNFLTTQEPEVYVLDRSDNDGYVSFETDTSIITGIADLFPVIFLLVAVLICVTTMERMVDEQRGQIGVLKALGYPARAILSIYALYAGMASAAGWALGYFLGTWALPKLFWAAYSSIYSFAPIVFCFDGKLAAGTFAVSLFSMLGMAVISCANILRSGPADLLMPPRPKAGQRILLERIRPVWKRLSFLQKVVLRNMFRYKKRFLLMLIGLASCTALVVVAFGVRDSFIDIGSMQYGGTSEKFLGLGGGSYEGVQTYSYEVQVDSSELEDVISEICSNDDLAEVLPACSTYVTVKKGGTSLSQVSLVIFPDEELDRISDFWNLYTGQERAGGSGTKTADLSSVLSESSSEAGMLVCIRTAEKLDLKKGSSFRISSEAENGTVREAGTFTSYAGNFILTTASEAEKAGFDTEPDTLYVRTDRASSSYAKRLLKISGVTGVQDMDAEQAEVRQTMSCLDYLIWVIVAFSAALEFLVILNLTNINIAERAREIATVEVLGFTRRETETYVLRENLILAVPGGAIGLLFGKFLHEQIVARVLVDNIHFPCFVTARSYILAMILTFLFALLIQGFMRRKIARIKMAESLKAVE